MPCAHDTFESSVVVTERPGFNPEAQAAFVYYVVAVQARCAACQSALVFDQLPAFTSQLAQIVSQTRGGLEARLVAHLPPTEAETATVTWAPTMTVRPEPPPAPATPTAG